MSVVEELSSSLLPPSFSEDGSPTLRMDSTLQELPLHIFQIDISFSGQDLIQIFERYPLLPGAVLKRQGQFVGMLSRHRVLEYLIRPQGMELFLKQSLEVLYSYARTELLILPCNTPIVVAAQQALRRPLELLGEPILVQIEPQTYQLLNIHELNVAYWQIRGIETQVRYERAQAQMIQTDKMASLGRLVDGLAHEVLDPVSFIWGNLTYVTVYSQSLLQLLSAYETYVEKPSAEIIELEQEIELDFIRQDLLRSIESIRVGAERLTKLATSLQNFCHIDAIYPKPADLHECLDSILLLLKSRLTIEIEIVKNYGYLPPVPCFIGDLNQVFMNIISNAVDALLDQAVRQKLASEFSDSVGEFLQLDSDQKPRIDITTEVLSLESANPSPKDSRWVSIRIANNGPSISPEQQKQIRESFSVEKRAAKETSLSVSYKIVTAKHGGQFRFRSPCFTSADSRPTWGTEFEILLPLL